MMEVSIHIAAIIFGSTAVGATLVSISTSSHRNTPLRMVIHNMALMVFRQVNAHEDDERTVIVSPVNLFSRYFNDGKVNIGANVCVYVIHSEIGLLIALSSVYSMLDKIHTNFPLYEIYVAVCIGLWFTTFITQCHYNRQYKQQRVIDKLRR